MDFNQLKTFITVVETGSFSRAGAKLFLSQPTVTTQVKSLEKELSNQLLVRSTNGIKTTEAGKYVFEYAQRTLRERENILGQFGKQKTGIKSINISASSIPGQYVLPQIIAAFYKTCPRIRVQLKLCNSSQVCKDIMEHQADFGMGGTECFQGDCEYLPIIDDPLVVITPTDGIYANLKQGEPFPEELLLQVPFVLREEGSGSRREFEKWLYVHTSSYDVNVAAIINDNQAIKKAVLAGTGISVMSARAVQEYVEAGRLKSFPLEGTANRKLYLMQRKKIKLMGDVRKFYEFVQEYLIKHKV